MEGYLKNQGIAIGGPLAGTRGGEVTLRAGEVFALSSDARGVTIVCQKGTLWVTQAEDIVDHLLRAGERFVVANKGRVLVQGLNGEGKARIMRPATV